MIDFLNDLNDVQREAVINYNGPSLIIAGAGSGKTRVLTYRIAYLLNQGVTPGSILALTFTNKAAKEMKERIAQLIGEDEARRLWMGTFHAMFSIILRREAAATGYPVNYTIYDTQDAKNVVKQIVKQLNLDEQVYKVNDVYGRISSAKNNMITANMYANSIMYKEDAYAKREHIAEIFNRYAQQCFKAGAMDFDDILLNTNILFRNHPDILDKYQRYFRYILVDEYQDTNFSQYLIIKKLAQQRCNICVVGDDAQSIYAFRGARIENILNFRNDYPNYQIFKLEQNYRSTQNIVNAANSLIEKNKNRIQKQIFSKNAEGDPIRVCSIATDQEEGYMVAASIAEMKHINKYDNKDFAILYRTNAQSRIFEEALRKMNIPYKIYGGQSFYERKEIKDVLAYGRLLINPKDDEAFRRVINFPARGIGNTTIGRLEAAATRSGISLWEASINAEQLAPDIAVAARGKIHKFIEFVSGYAEKQRTLNAYELMHQIVKATGIIKSLQEDKSPDNISRLQNIDELLNGIRLFVDENESSLTLSAEGDSDFRSNDVVTLDQFMANVSLLTNADNEKTEDKDKVTVMTVHQAKGLEFEVVYIVGVEENLFPSMMSTMSDLDVEEERRLFYVALTRARKSAIISYSGFRFRWGSMTTSSPSRFIKEIDPCYLELAGNTTRLSHFKTNNTYNFTQKTSKPIFNTGNNFAPKLKPLEKSQTSHPASGIDPNSGGLHDTDTEENIKPGMMVEHFRFGLGKVLALDEGKATINFGNAGQKQLILKFAKLKIVK